MDFQLDEKKKKKIINTNDSIEQNLYLCNSRHAYILA